MTRANRRRRYRGRRFVARRLAMFHRGLRARFLEAYPLGTYSKPLEPVNITQWLCQKVQRIAP